jgi:predicted AlkP superfamily pyrophosphatase or phosphodiesterase
MKTAVLNVVGLTSNLIGADTPHLSAWAARGRQALIKPAFPAVTCTAQADYLTGVYPEQHGIVGNGWYFRDDCEIRFWRQSNKLVRAPKIWDTARAANPAFTCANLFWWFNMYSTADYAVTPRPIYRADGAKFPDIYTTPAPLRDDLQSQLGAFPLFDFWGPKTSIRSSQWIADAAIRVDQQHDATLSLVYLPHLDYGLQRLGPRDPGIAGDLRAIDAVCGQLIEYFESRGARVIVLSEYGVVDVSRPIHLNRGLREHGLLAVREELGGELLDAGASAAFAVADHQVAHVYVNDPRQMTTVRAVLEKIPGVDQVLDRAQQAAHRLAHDRAGDFVVIAEADAWFTYYYWLDDSRAPDFARTVDIHRKPGYDPVELILDPALRVPALQVGWKLAKKQLGFRYLMDVIPLDASLVKGSHGRPGEWDDDGPVLITRQPDLLPSDRLLSVDVAKVILKGTGLGLWKTPD